MWEFKYYRVHIPHLSSRFPAAVLPALLEARVPVGPDDPVVQSGTVNEAHGVFSVSSGVVSSVKAAKERHSHFVLKFRFFSIIIKNLFILFKIKKITYKKTIQIK